MPADFDAIYDEATAARLDRADGVNRTPRPDPPSDVDPVASGPVPARWRRRAVTGGLLTGLALGLREVFDPPPDEDEIIQEVDVDAPPRDDQPVRIVLIEGAPRASRIILRPWLARA